ncbi:MAG: RC-LH1 core complex protein PufX [Pseudomonadota bacterium]
MSDILRASDDTVQTEFTAGQIFGYMAQGAFYAAALLFFVAAFVVFFYVIGRILPPEEAYFSALDMAVRAFA